MAAVEEEDSESAFDLEAEYQKRIAWVNDVPLFQGLEAEAAAAALPPGAVSAFMDDLARRFSVSCHDLAGIWVAFFSVTISLEIICVAFFSRCQR